MKREEKITNRGNKKTAEKTKQDIFIKGRKWRKRLHIVYMKRSSLPYTTKRSEKGKRECEATHGQVEEREKKDKKD